MTGEELEEMIVQRARLWLDGGAMFGESGTGFQRVNVACPRQNIGRGVGEDERGGLSVKRILAI